MDELPLLLTRNSTTLNHLILSAYLHRPHSWDAAFSSPSTRNLTYLDLCDTRISTMVLNRVMGIQGLRGLTLHGTFEDWKAARVVFGGDYILAGKHILLPELESFRFVMVGVPPLPGLPGQGLAIGGLGPGFIGVGGAISKTDETALYESIIRFLRDRPKLRRLDLGGCPWEFINGEITASAAAGTDPLASANPVSGGFGAGVVFDPSLNIPDSSFTDSFSNPNLLTTLPALRVLHVSFTHLTIAKLRSLVEVLPEEMIALSVSVGSSVGAGVSEKGMHEYVVGSDGEGNVLAKLRNLSFLHLREDRLVGRGRAGHPGNSSNPQPTQAGPSNPNANANFSSTQQPGPSSSRPRRNHAQDQDVHRTAEQTEADPEVWVAQARSVACRMPSLDFVGWHGEHYVVVRSGFISEPGGKGKETQHQQDIAGGIKPSPSPVMSLHPTSSLYPSSSHVRPYPHVRPYSTPLPSTLHIPSTGSCTFNGSGLCSGAHIDLKELPSRRRLDCGKGVDLGGEDAAWLERKDVPVDYEEPGL